MDFYFSLTNLATAAICFLALLATIFFDRKLRSHHENKKVASSSLSLLALPSSLPISWKHHVFPSFHGGDVRTNFLSHVMKEFRSKGIDLFIDNNIEKSKPIEPELIEAIKGSRIAIVMLSKNYASSTWCLNELVEIMKCREELRQTVISLFYQVDPTDVRKQTGDFGKVFEETCEGKTEEEIRRWKHALTEVAQIAGYHSTNWKTEAKMIEDIATDVSNKLNLSAPCNDFDDLIGMDRKRHLLQLHSHEVRKIGIWGPPGIGKTTIARYLFNRYSQDFQLTVFIDNIKRKYAIPACSDDYSVKLYLQKQLMSQLTKEPGINVSHLGVIKDRLQDKKVLVVLDDVDHLVQLEAMAKETYWFGPGSRIIVTTQDRGVLEASGINHIHRVNLPSDDEALQMFCIYAFGQKDPKDGFKELALKVMDLVGRLPLELRVIGSYFRGRAVQYWTDALPRLKTHLDPKGEITSILKFSYDALLNEDKRLFIHIACFFNSEKVEIVKGCLAKSFVDVTQGLHVLLEKSLIDIDSREQIWMPELLVQLGRKIVREEYASDPGKRLFFYDAVDIGEVLSDDNTRTDLYEDITGTSERAFEKWPNLQFLKIQSYDTKLRSIGYISQKLRVLIWKGSKMTCFPSNFNPKFLVKLEMEHSELEKLWDGTQILNNLKWMNLSNSERLKELPDLSTATNLQKLNLSYCVSLVELPYSIGNAINIKKLDLRCCSSLVKLPSSIGNIVNLENLDLNHCSSLVKFPSSIVNAINPNKLDLIYCSSLVKLPSSIGNATNLRELNLYNCSSLVKLPSSIGNATNLRELNLSNCSSLVKLPSSIGNAINLKYLNLCECSSLVELPSSIGNAVNLDELNLRYCSSLVELPSSMRNLGRLRKLDSSRCSKLEVNLANINLESLKYLYLPYCSLLKTYPESSTEIQELEPWAGRISRLLVLALDGMRNLVSLPQLPYSVVELDAENCASLERLDCSFLNPDIRLNFANCFKLNKEAKDLLIHTLTNKYAVFRAEEVPQCFPYRSLGSSLTVKLDQMPLGKSTKFKACCIFADEYDDETDFRSVETDVCCSITSGGIAITACSKSVRKVYPRNLYIFEVEVETEKVRSTELVFDFKLGSWEYDEMDTCETRMNFERWEIKECGILQSPLLSFRGVNEDS